MEPIIIKPEPSQKTVMFIVWGIILVLVSAGLIPLIIFIPEFGAKIVLGINLVVFLLIMLLYALWIPAFYRTLEYTIDSEAVRAKRGVIWKRRVTIPYPKITNVDISEGPLQRMYHIGTVHVQTAGAGGQQGGVAELRLTGVKDLESIKDIVMAGVQGVIHSKTPSSAPESAQPSTITGDSETLRSMLGELQAIRRAVER